MPLSTTRSELLKKRVEQFTRALHGLEKGDVRALHQARVASRRMRELLPLLQLDRSVSRKLGRRLRKVTGRLGTVRELDVQLLLIEELHVCSRRGSGALGRVGVRVSKNRDEERKRLFGHLPVARMARLARKLDRIVADLKEVERASSKSAARNWRWGIDARVASRASGVFAAITDAGAMYLPDRLHAVRIAMKKLRYAVELSMDAAGVRTSADLLLLKRSQELLGRLHDQQMLIEEVRQTQASLAPPSVSVWRDLDALIASLEDDCRRLHARYMRMRDQLQALAERLSNLPDAHDGRAAARRAG